jgi:hypothetical protein
MYYWEWLLIALSIILAIVVYLARQHFDKPYQDIKAQLDDQFEKQRQFCRE